VEALMPYIKQEDRKKFKFAEMEMTRIETVGELNYFITKACLSYLNTKGMSYQICNDIIGVLTCAAQEFYRRLVVPYEDQKIHENGDVV